MQLRAGTIRRLIRRGNTLICGLCRRAYSDAEEASQCIVSCWQELLDQDPVIERRRAVSTQYRCRFCARDHANRRLAASCAESCRRRQIDLFAVELGLDDADSGTRRRWQPRVKPVMVAPPPRPKPRPVPASPAGEATPAAAVHTGAPISADIPVAKEAPAAPPAPAAAAAPASPPAAAAAEADGKKYKDADVFLRDGARYICKTCKKKYFTRDEVVKCFEEHNAAGAPAPEPS